MQGQVSVWCGYFYGLVALLKTVSDLKAYSSIVKKNFDDIDVHTGPLIFVFLFEKVTLLDPSYYKIRDLQNQTTTEKDK